MKKLIPFLLFFLTVTITFAQIPSYYNDVNLNLSGSSLKNELASKIISTHTTNLSYTPGVWDALKQTDLDPTSSSRVLLVYGYSSSGTTARTRGVNDNGGATSDWNREHVYPKSLGNPNLGTSGPGADVHHIRPADVTFNSQRGNLKFVDASGNARSVSGGWYPGDEWKGDVARMMMYMYLRYGNQCLPSNVGIGSSASSDANMLQLFLEWNAEDPVSNFEIQRNPILEGLQGNRNPFIDNPAFATEIWGGPQAEDRFGNTGGGGSGGGGGNTLCSSTVTSFPYSQSFENTFSGWNQASTDNFNWSLNSGSTPSSNTGPSSANAGSYYIYMESSSPNNSNDRAILYGPCFNLSSANQASVTFKYHMYGASNMGSLSLEASLNGTSWTSIWNKSGNQGNSWQTATVDLSGYLGQTVQLRLNGITGTTWQGDMAVDAFNVSTSGSSGGGSNDPCEGVSEWSSSTSYSVGARVTYFGNLYERTSSGWVLLGACGASRSAGNVNTPTPPPFTATFNVYPNPTKQFLNINLANNKEASYKIVNYIGQTLTEGILSNTTTIDMSELQKGSYILRVTNGKETFTKQIIKQ